MPSCPACGAEPDEGAACPGCGLAKELFEPIHLAAGGVPSGGRYAEDVQDLIEALGDLAAAPPPATAPTPPDAPAPPAAAPATGPAASPASGLAIADLPLRSGATEDLAGLRRRNQEYLELGERLGIDVSEDRARAQRLARVDEPTELDRLGRDLFVRLADSLTRHYERDLEHRSELARHLPAGPIDRELETARARLAEGALERAHAALEAADLAVDRTEEEWGPVLVLLENARALAEGVRSFGADPAGAIGPVTEGERLAKAGERARAERALAAGNLALWSVLHPLVRADLPKRVQRIRSLEAGGAPVAPALAEMREFAAQLEAKNFSGALAAYRRAAEWLESPGGPAPAGPSLNNGPSVPPA